MMFLENKSYLKWIALAIFFLPAFAVFDLASLLLCAPACLLGIMLIWHAPIQMLVVAPEHIEDALEEYIEHEEIARLTVYYKSMEAYAEVIRNSDYDSTDYD